MSRTRRHQVSVSLFPFLAVLICIMGALVILLVLMVARVGAGVKAVASGELAGAGSADDQQLREQLEDAQWQRSMLLQSRSEKTQELADKREELSHLENHIRQLDAEATRLVEQAKKIDAGQSLREGDLAAARVESAKLKSDIATKRAALEARQAAAAKEPSFALIPYDGPNGTRRRPIYIECTEVGVVVHPEGLLFKADDFSGPLGPGNPLDAALRTIREHLRQTGGKAGEPYPLLVVRPGGVAAYGAARDALQAWDDEFGYELVGDDKRLDFGEPEPALAVALKDAVTAARQRQAMMAAMMPRRFHGESFGGPSPVEGGPMLGAAGSSAPGRGVGTGGGGSGTGLAGGRGGGHGDAMGLESYPAGTSGGAPPGSGGGAVGAPGGSEPPRPFPGGAGGNAASRNATAGAGPQGQAPGAGGGPASAGAVPGGGGGQPAGKLAYGRPRPGPPGGAGSGRPGSQASGGGSAQGNAARGNNWGLPGSRGRVTAVTRMIHLAVLSDRIVIVPEQGDERLPKHLPVSPELTPAEVDRFVAAVQREIQGWGLAVEDGYWKPLLLVEVAPDAESQAQQLETALQGSGFDIQRKLR